MAKHKEQLSDESLKRIQACIAATGRKEYLICEDLGVQKAYFSGMRRTRSVPSGTLACRMAAYFGVSAEYLLDLDREGALNVQAPEGSNLAHQYAAQLLTQVTSITHQMLQANGHRLNFNEMLAWWRASGRTLNGLDDVENQFDLVHVPGPEDQILSPHRVGHNSLAGIYVGRCATRLRRVVKAMSVEQQANLMADYRRATDFGDRYEVHRHQLDLEVPTISRRIVLNYDRLLLPVTAADGRRFIISHCYPALEASQEHAAA